MPEDKPLITPQWLMKARRDRARFVGLTVAVFLVLTALSFWALPRLQDAAAAVQKEGGGAPLKGHIATLVWLAGVFRVAWYGIAMGCGAAILYALTGHMDGLLPVLSGLLLAVGLGAVAFTAWVFFVPFMSLLKQAT